MNIFRCKITDTNDIQKLHKIILDFNDSKSFELLREKMINDFGIEYLKVQSDNDEIKLNTIGDISFKLFIQLFFMSLSLTSGLQNIDNNELFYDGPLSFKLFNFLIEYENTSVFIFRKTHNELVISLMDSSLIELNDVKLDKADVSIIYEQKVDEITILNYNIDNELSETLSEYFPEEINILYDHVLYNLSEFVPNINSEIINKIQNEIDDGVIESLPVIDTAFKLISIPLNKLKISEGKKFLLIPVKEIKTKELNFESSETQGVSSKDIFEEAFAIPTELVVDDGYLLLDLVKVKIKNDEVLIFLEEARSFSSSYGYYI